MRVPLVLLSGIVVFSVAVARALSCVCSPLECDVLTEDDCPGGLTWDPCQCCKVCARVEGEACGGLFGFSGSCAVGLQCVIKNLLHHTKEVDEGICSKIPGRWRRHCPQGLKMSSPGCNLIGEGMTNRPGNALSAGRCSCGPAVLWCPSEPRPYTYETRHECILNLVAKLTYDQMFNTPDLPASNKVADGARCPPDSILTEDGACKCVSVCPTNKCRPGERPLEVKAAAVPVTPGSCCPLYDCLPSEQVSWDQDEDVQPRKKCIDDSGIPRDWNEQWQQGPCVNCTCETGSVSCHATMCKSCETEASIVPGECCPRCLAPTNDTSTVTNTCPTLDDCQSPCEIVASGSDECPICKCPENEHCPPLHLCGPNCMLVKDEHGCHACSCNDNVKPDSSPPQSIPGISEDSGAVCPELKCDLHCERGLVMDENDCTLCQCKPQTGCPSMMGCKKKCPYGYKTNKRGCPVCRCRATCTDLHNTTHPEGTSWEPDACTACICDYVGRLVCKETVCSVACINPLPPPPGSCCPICPKKHPDKDGTIHHAPRGWGTVPIILISSLALICILLVFYVLRGRFRGRISQKTTLYSTYPTQYYKSVPAYETPNHRSEKIVPL